MKAAKPKGVLLVNLGSPDSPDTSHVRRYLREFLMDRRVLDAPYPIRFGVVHGMILPFRPRQSAEAYHKIWTPEGSPLIATSRRVQQQLQQRLAIPVELAMRYQNPSIESAVRKLKQDGVRELLLITLFPHYAMSSFETAVERVKHVLRRLAPEMELRVVPPYYDDPDYIAALVSVAEPFLKGGYDHLLFSFHGVPERHLRKSDPTGCHCLKAANCCETPSPAHATCYRAQCFKTMRAFMTQAQIPVTSASIAFQSRLGREPWLRPYTDHELVRLARSGVKKLLVICPAFVTDCLETLEEIGIRGRETFLAAGGKDFALIPCLNEHPAWIAFLERLIGEFTSEDEQGVSSESVKLRA
jgi:protoporphyrin/coproporphyrin ferrochelatase